MDKKSPKPRVLIVDDERFYSEVLENLLSPQFEIDVAGTGELALAKAQTEPQPDLILLDIMMNGMDGYEVCRRLKQNAQTRDIPVIFLTVKRDIDDEVRGFNLGAVDYITKPMSPPIVRARVRNHIELGRLKKRLIECEKRCGKKNVD